MMPRIGEWDVQSVGENNEVPEMDSRSANASWESGEMSCETRERRAQRGGGGPQGREMKGEGGEMNAQTDEMKSDCGGTLPQTRQRDSQGRRT